MEIVPMRIEFNFLKNRFSNFWHTFDLCMEINCNCLVRLLCYHIVVFRKMNLKIFYIIPLVRLLAKCHFWISLFWHRGRFFWFSLFEILIMRQFLFFLKKKSWNFCVKRCLWRKVIQIDLRSRWLQSYCS